jgi:hypothetical protein
MAENPMSPSPRWMVLCGVFAVSCDDKSGDGLDDDETCADCDSGVGEEPDIEVDPATIDFGSVSAVDTASGASPPDDASVSVTIRNVGIGNLQLTGIDMETEGGPFVVGAVSSPSISSEGTATFTVTFRPETAGAVSGHVLIESNDPDEGVVAVELIGTGIAPVIDVAPLAYDFGTLVVGCEDEQPITISNIGNAELVIQSFVIDADTSDLDFDDQTDANGDLPWDIPPGGSLEVMATHRPLDEDADSASLLIYSNDPATPMVTASLRGQAERFGTTLDVFEQPLQGRADILFAVDRSCSMNDDIDAMAGSFSALTTTLGGLDADYHVAATVEDDGCINGADLWIDDTFSASDARTALTAMLNLGASYSSNTERQFTLLQSALEASADPSGCNWGLVRPDASLNLVGVSDEPEQSVNDYTYYVSLFQSLKANPDDVRIHAIGGDYPGGCGSAAAYTGFYEATVATGGLYLSICASDWTSHMEALAEASAPDMSSFELTDWPVTETIVVRVDGVPLTEGWAYSPTHNGIDFDSTHLPAAGATVEVEYAQYGGCD